MEGCRSRAGLEDEVSVCDWCGRRPDRPKEEETAEHERRLLPDRRRVPERLDKRCWRSNWQQGQGGGRGSERSRRPSKSAWELVLVVAPPLKEPTFDVQNQVS